MRVFAPDPNIRISTNPNTTNTSPKKYKSHPQIRLQILICFIESGRNKHDPVTCLRRGRQLQLLILKPPGITSLSDNSHYTSCHLLSSLSHHYHPPLTSHNITPIINASQHTFLHLPSPLSHHHHPPFTSYSNTPLITHLNTVLFISILHFHITNILHLLHTTSHHSSIRLNTFLFILLLYS